MGQKNQYKICAPLLVQQLHLLHQIKTQQFYANFHLLIFALSSYRTFSISAMTTCIDRTFTAVGTWPWTNRFTSARTTIVSSSSQSHMVDSDWIHILGKQRLPCVKGKVIVYVTCQCYENRCFWRVIDHK